MVRASLGSKAKLSVPKAPEIKGTAVEESYPMYAIPVKDFLQLKKWRPHQVCWRRERGLGTGGAGAASAARTLRSVSPNLAHTPKACGQIQDLLADGGLIKVDDTRKADKVIFISHQWTSFNHPDPKNEQLKALQMTIRNLLSGKATVRTNWALEMGYGIKKVLYGVPIPPSPNAATQPKPKPKAQRVDRSSSRIPTLPLARSRARRSGRSSSTTATSGSTTSRSRSRSPPSRRKRRARLTLALAVALTLTLR